MAKQNKTRARAVNTAITLLTVALLIAATVGLGKRAAGSFLAESGLVQLKGRNYSQSVQDMQAATALAPYSPSYWYIYGQSLYQMAGEARDAKIIRRILSRALLAFKRAVEINPLESRGWAGMARVSSWLSRINQDRKLGEVALNYLNRALTIDPNNGLYRYQQVQFNLFLGNWAEAAESIRKLARVSPLYYTDISFPGWKGQGREPFRRSLAEAVKNPLVDEDALSVLAFIAAERKDWTQAAAYMQEMVERSNVRTRPSLLVRKGLYLLEAGDAGGAETSLLDALKLQVIHSRLAMLNRLLEPLRQKGDVKLFMHLAQEAAMFDTEVYEALPLLMGEGLYYVGKLEAASAEFNKSLESRDNATARLFLARIALDQQDWDEAELQAQRASTLNRVNPSIYHIWAQALLAQGKPRPALDAIEQAIRYSGKPGPGQPDPRPEYLDLQAGIYFDLRNLPQAEQAWKKAFELSPFNSDYAARLANLYAEDGDLIKAKRYYQAALRLNPTSEPLREQVRLLDGLTPTKKQ